MFRIRPEKEDAEDGARDDSKLRIGLGAGVRNFATDIFSAIKTRAPLPKRGWQVEPQTGISFPPRFPTESTGGRELDLVGLGVRAKWGIKVYAAAMYADTRRVKSSLSGKWGNVDADKLDSSTEFTEDFKNADFEKAVLMQMSRRIPQSMLIKAIDSSVDPRLKNSDRKILPRFNEIVHDALGNLTIRRGTQIRMKVSRRGVLSVSVDDDAPKELQHAPLCRAIVDMYVGADPVSPAAKKDICEGVSKLLKKEEHFKVFPAAPRLRLRKLSDDIAEPKGSIQDHSSSGKEKSPLSLHPPASSQSTFNDGRPVWLRPYQDEFDVTI